MKQSDFWQNFINKQVTFRYMRQELQFDLSQSLFSSADVDIGSRFLLRTISKMWKQRPLPPCSTLVAVWACLGLSLKKINPTST